MGPLAPLGPVPAFAGSTLSVPSPSRRGASWALPCRWCLPRPDVHRGVSPGLPLALASPSRRRGPPGLPVCRSGCAGPAAVACPLPPSPLRGPGATGCCSELSSLRIDALPLPPCRGPCEARGGAGGEWRCGPAPGGNLYHMGGTLLSRPECTGSKFLTYGKGATITGELHRMAVQPCRLGRSADEPTGRASIHTAGTAPGS